MIKHLSASNAWRKRPPGCDVVMSDGHASSPDRDLLRLIEHGDLKGAVRKLMLLYGAGVYRYCREALGGDAVLADDVQQQVFIEAFRDLPRFRGQSSLRSWLFSIARHRILDAAKMRRRARARISPGDLTDELADAPDPRPSPAESVDSIRLLAALRASLAELDEPTRTAILLRYQHGFTYQQIAELCGERPGTLHARVLRAMPRLRAGIESRIHVMQARRAPLARGPV